MPSVWMSKSWSGELLLIPTLPSEVIRSLSCLELPLVALVEKVMSVGMVFPLTVPFTTASISAVSFSKSVPSAPLKLIAPSLSPSATVVTAPVDVPLVLPNLIYAEFIAF